MRKKYIYLFLSLFLLAFAGKTAWDMHLQSQGICLEKGRALTDEEKIRFAIARLNNIPGRMVNNVYYKYVPYDSVDAFLKDNPDCCHVVVHGKWPKFPSYGLDFKWDKALGVYAGHVHLKYKLYYMDEKNVKRFVNDKIEFTIQNCGIIN